MPIAGLVAYDDDPLSDHEDRPSPPATAHPTSKLASDGDQLNLRAIASSDNLKRNLRTPSSTPSSKPPVIIRRHIPAKPHLRARLPDDPNDQPGPSDPARDLACSHSQTTDELLTDETADELTRIRQLLRPPPIPGVQDWGIPPEPAESCDGTIEAKVTQFLALKRDPQHPIHFNDTLMSKRTFRNPHLYTSLVEFVDVDERTTNFPKHLWDPTDVKEEWYADRIAEAQKARSEATSAAQHSSKRARIDFAAGILATSSSAAQRDRPQPYNVASRGAAQRSAGEGVLGGGSRRRGKTRWG